MTPSNLITMPLEAAEAQTRLIATELSVPAGALIIVGCVLLLWKDHTAEGILSAILMMFASVMAMHHMEKVSGHVTKYVDYVVVEKLHVNPVGLAEIFHQKIKDAQASQESNKPWIITAAFKSFIHAGMMLAMLLIGLLAAILQGLGYVAQKALLLFFRALSPLAIGALSFQSTRSVGVSFFLHFLGVALWPLGWGVCSIVTSAILQFSVTDIEAPPVVDSVMLAGQSMLSIFIVAIWIKTSTIFAPIVIQVLVAGGSSPLGTAPRMLHQAMSSMVQSMDRVGDVGKQVAQAAQQGHQPPSAPAPLPPPAPAPPPPPATAPTSSQ